VKCDRCQDSDLECVVAATRVRCKACTTDKKGCSFVKSDKTPSSAEEKGKAPAQASSATPGPSSFVGKPPANIVGNGLRSLAARNTQAAAGGDLEWRAARRQSIRRDMLILGDHIAVQTELLKALERQYAEL
jgi:hypothetical protein